MDEVLFYCEEVFFNKYIYPEDFCLEQGSIGRQILSLSIIEIFGGYGIYLITSGIAYILFFDKELCKHPLFLKVTLSIKILPLNLNLTNCHQNLINIFRTKLKPR